MNYVNKIYTNDIGISFQWTHVETDLTQVIFRDTGFHLTEQEIECFLEKVIEAKNTKKCPSCKVGDDCKSILLQTPSDKISLAVSKVELGQIEDLLKGTIFQIRLNEYVEDICRN